VVPEHWLELPELLECAFELDEEGPVFFPSQQFVPTFLLCTLQKQLFDLLRLHFMQSN
jgi:hypothetical protein